MVKVHLTNSLPPTAETNLLGFQKNLTNLHTHGWHVSPTPPRTTLCMLWNPARPTTMNTIPRCRNPERSIFIIPTNMAWWPNSIGPPGRCLGHRRQYRPAGSFETHILILKDITLSGNQPAPHATMMDYMHGKEGNVIMVNGLVNPRLYMKTGQVQRWRVLKCQQRSLLSFKSG